MPSQRLFTQEAAGYLIPLLDKERDAAEIADLRAKQSDIAGRPRAITPIAIPLTDDLPAHGIVDRLARVRFDADGSGPREWTWITPDAGWLVYDAADRGTITSALQLFGNVTFWLFWSNGYEPMRALDDNGDGELVRRGAAATLRSGTTAIATASRTRAKCGRSPRTASWRCRATTSQATARASPPSRRGRALVGWQHSADL